MSIDYIKFCVEIEELDLSEPMEINYNHDFIDKIVIFNSIKTFPKTVITFYFNNIDDFEVARDMAKNELDDILNRISFIADSYVGEPVDIKYKLAGVDDEVKIGHNYEALVEIYVGLPDKVKKSIEEGLEYPIGLYEQYKGALKSKDIVARYMFLYNILLQICNDNQKNIDDFIENKFGTDICGFTKSPIGNFNESTYTRLRNEIAHMRNNTNFDNTRAEMKDNIKMLMKIVKKAINSVDKD